MMNEFTKWQKYIESELRALKVAKSGTTPGGSSIAYNGTVEFQKNGQTVGTFSANQSSNVVINYSIPTNGVELWSGNSYANLTLSDDIANYSRLKIVYGDDGYGYRTEELDLSVGTKARLELSYINTGTFFQRTALLTFSGTTVTMTQQAGVSTAYGNTMVYQSGYKIFIRKIIGIKD